MPVLLPSGIVCVSTTRTRIRSARRAIPSGVSKVTPAGAAPKVGSLGNREGQGKQRPATIPRAPPQGGGAPPAGTAAPPPLCPQRNTPPPRAAAARGTAPPPPP